MRREEKYNQDMGFKGEEITIMVRGRCIKRKNKGKNGGVVFFFFFSIINCFVCYRQRGLCRYGVKLESRQGFFGHRYGKIPMTIDQWLV